MATGENLFSMQEEKEKNITLKIKLHLKIILGFLVGFISAPMGIGGAVMNVPILKFFGYSINRAIGSAAAIGFLIALFGAIGFLITGSYLKTNIPLERARHTGRGVRAAQTDAETTTEDQTRRRSGF